jgi:predicted site-specific integrase-resolvase
MDRPGYLPLKEAAGWAGVSARTVKRWIADGLPCYQAGHRTKVLIRPMDIDQFLTRRQVPKIDIDALVEKTLREMEEEQNRKEVA